MTDNNRPAAKETTMTDLTIRDLKDAIEDLKGMIQAAARRPGSGKIQEIRDYRLRKSNIEAELARRGRGRQVDHLKEAGLQ